MSNAVLNAVWTLQMPPSPKAVLVALADRASTRARACWPSVADLMARTCLSKRSVLNAIEGLEASRAITVARSHRKANRYVITPESFKSWVHVVHPKLGAPRAPSRVHHVHPQGAPVAPQPSFNPHEEPSMLANASLSKTVFTLGRRLLVQGGKSKASAASLLAKLRKEHGDRVLLEVLQSAEREHVSDPAGWLVKNCRSQGSRRTRLGIGEQDYSAGWGGEKVAA